MFYSFRRFWRGNVFALLIVSFLFTAFLFTGCETEPDDFVDDDKLNEDIIGTWKADYDGYAITATKLTYNGFDTDSSYSGTIVYVSNFTDTGGVIVIKYSAGNTPKYYGGYDPDTYLPIGDPLPLKGDFIGIYYKNLKPGVSIQMGGAFASGGAEEKTLDAAIKAFTKGNEGTYMTYYGTYLKK